MKQRWFKLLLIAAGLYLLPWLTTLLIRKNIPETDTPVFDSGITVYMGDGSGAQALDLDEYLTGVVAAQLPEGYLPGDYPGEALKCQAVLARTHAMNIIGSRTQITAGELGQEYFSLNVLREKYGSGYAAAYRQLAAAVCGTSEEVLTYDGKPAMPAYFYCSNGMTRSAETVWGSAIAYLTPVESSADTDCKEQRSQVTMTIADCIRKLQESRPDFQASAEGLKDTVQILQKDDSGYVTRIQMGNTEFSGEELRSALGLSSADFEVRVKSRTITFDVTGVGHGVGLSQWGARAMALEGKGCREILAWYFPGTEVKP